MERQWQWGAAHVTKHSLMAMTLDDGSHTLVQVLKCGVNGSVVLSTGAPGDRPVRVARMERHTRVQLLEATEGNMCSC